MTRSERKELLASGVVMRVTGGSEEEGEQALSG